MKPKKKPTQRRKRAAKHGATYFQFGVIHPGDDTRKIHNIDRVFCNTPHDRRVIASVVEAYCRIAADQTKPANAFVLRVLRS